MYTVAESLTLVEAALVARMETDGEDFCFTGSTPAQEIPMGYVTDCDGDTCGMAWVRIVTSYPAERIGEPVQGGGPCPPFMGYDLEIGMVRCFAFIDEDGEPPAPAEAQAAATQQATDIRTMQQIILCSGLDEDDFALATWAEISGGGIVGGAWLVQGLAR